MRAAFPHSSTEYLKDRAEEVAIFSSRIASMFSLKEWPAGPDMFMTMRTLPFFSTAIMELQRKFSKGGAEKGPATNFFRTHSVKVSVKTAPWRWTEVALATRMPGSGSSWQASVPQRISEHASFARTSWCTVNLSCTCCRYDSMTWGRTWDCGLVGKSQCGKFSQKLGGGGNLYDDSYGILGCFLGGSTGQGSSGTGNIMFPVNHSSAVCQSAGMPKKLLFHPEKKRNMLVPTFL